MTTFDNFGPVRIAYLDEDPRYTADILVQVRGENNTWVTVGRFNSISDDYAMTNARECANKNLDNINRARVVSHGAAIAPGTSIDNLKTG